MRKLLLLSLLFFLSSPAISQLAIPNEQGLTYGHMHLNVSDIELHKRLWVEMFGGELVQKGPITAIKFPNTIIALYDAAPTGDSIASVINHFGFKVRNLEKFLSKWRSKGFAVESEFIGSEGQNNAYIMMPDNVYVELQEDQALPVELSGYHVHLYAPEHEELLRWYLDVFDLEARPRGQNIPFSTNVPGMNISFASSNEARAASKGRAIDHIGFEVDDLESFCKKLEEKGIVFDVPYTEIPAIGLKVAFITDPAGTYIELSEGSDNF